MENIVHSLHAQVLYSILIKTIVKTEQIKFKLKLLETKFSAIFCCS